MRRDEYAGNGAFVNRAEASLYIHFSYIDNLSPTALVFARIFPSLLLSDVGVITRLRGYFCTKAQGF
jgi:cytochrome c-type biogenesis protein CcmE